MHAIKTRNKLVFHRNLCVRDRMSTALFFFQKILQITKQKFNPSLNFLLKLVFHSKIIYRNFLDLNSTNIQPCLLLAIKHVYSSILTASVERVNTSLRSCAGWLDSLVTLLSWCTWNDTVDNGEVCVTKHTKHFLS